MSDFYKKFTRLTHTHRLLGQRKDLRISIVCSVVFIYKKRDELSRHLCSALFMSSHLCWGTWLFPWAPLTGSWPPLCHPIKEIPGPWSTLLFADLPDLCRSIRESPHSRSPNYRGRKSKLCVLGIEKRAQTYITRLCAYSYRYFRPQWKRRQQVWGKKSSWEKLFQVISVEKRIITILHLKYKL